MEYLQHQLPSGLTLVAQHMPGVETDAGHIFLCKAPRARTIWEEFKRGQSLGQSEIIHDRLVAAGVPPKS